MSKKCWSIGEDLPYLKMLQIFWNHVIFYIIQCIHYHGLTPNKIFTSEDAKSYKPRAELFEMALKETNLNPQEIVHIGDSLSSDMKEDIQFGNQYHLNESE